METIIGVDVGNYDTKTAHTTTVSGYTVYDNEQLLSDKVLVYNGKYYVESTDSRFPFSEDKTVDDQCLILTLFAIAKELLWRITNGENRVTDINEIKNEIKKYDTLSLPIGLPPGHFNKLARKTKEYYDAKLKDGFAFKYEGITFSFSKLKHIEVYAQDLSAVMMAEDLTVKAADGPSKYYIIGIGGYTADIIPIVDGVPEAANCRSLPLGTRPMFESIIARAQSSVGITLNERAIEDILKNRKHFFKPDVVAAVKQYTATYAKQIVDRCVQAGCDVSMYPVVYVGGGCLLLKDELLKNPNVCYAEFVEDTRANASSYEAFMKKKYNMN